MTARDMVSAVVSGQLSARELLSAHLAQIDAWNPHVNAIVTLDAEGALRAARAADERQANGAPLPPLHGLPIVHKDLFPTAGMRTTYGSRAFADHVPDESHVVVARAQAAGAIALGKTNTPEFGAGSQTFNAVFGATRNPFDLSKTCGGSSGGSAVALACGMAALADGTDMGGSLRCPANFCNIVGLRPSLGRIPSWPATDAYGTLSVAGPMARNVADLALLFAVQAGADDRCPYAIEEDGSRFAGSLDSDCQGLNVAFSFDLGGLPVAPEVIGVLDRSLGVFENLGANVEAASPDFDGAHETFATLRALAYETAYGPILDLHRERLKASVVWNIEAGRALRGADIAAAWRLRTALCARMHEFMRRYDVLIAPVNQVAPFPVDQEYVTAINGVAMESYFDWMRSCYYVTATGYPAISVPCGFTDDGLPVGLQIVGRLRGEKRLLQIAHAFEQATGTGARHPVLPPADRPAGREPADHSRPAVED